MRRSDESANRFQVSMLLRSASMDSDEWRISRANFRCKPNDARTRKARTITVRALPSSYCLNPIFSISGELAVKAGH